MAFIHIRRIYFPKCGRVHLKACAYRFSFVWHHSNGERELLFTDFMCQSNFCSFVSAIYKSCFDIKNGNALVALQGGYFDRCGLYVYICATVHPNVTVYSCSRIPAA